jgi:S1-C subfamily serine protease
MMQSDDDRNDVNNKDDTQPSYQPYDRFGQQDEQGRYSTPQAGESRSNEQIYQDYSHPEAYRAPSAQSEQSTESYRSAPLSSYSPYASDNYERFEQPTTDDVTHRSYQQQQQQQDVARPQQAASGGNVPLYTPYPPTPGAGTPARKSGMRTGAIAALALVVAIVFGTGIFAGWEYGHNSGGGSNTPSLNPAQAFQNEPAPSTKIPALTSSNAEAVREAVVNAVRPAVVQLTLNESNGTALGSGVIIDKNGYIVTNDHVVAGATSVTEVQLADGTIIHNAPVVATDAADDLAVVKINPPAKITVAPIGNSSALQVGEDVLAIGNPLGNTQTVTNGIVSALNRNVSEGQGGATLPGAIQTDAPINPGNSGGALVNMSGQLIGIPTLTAVDPEFNSPANGVGFAIPSNRVQYITAQVIQTGKVTHTGRAAIGIQPTDVDPSVQALGGLAVNHGVLITQLVQGGAAQKAGMQQGDVIVQIDNTQITDTSSLEDALLTKNPGDTVTVKAYRGSNIDVFHVTLGELQAQ